MGYIDFCSACKYSCTTACKHGSKECNQEKARIMLEISEQNEIFAKNIDKYFTGSKKDEYVAACQERAVHYKQLAEECDCLNDCTEAVEKLFKE